MAKRKKRLFCEINHTTYLISLYKEIFKRCIKNLFDNTKFAQIRTTEDLPESIHSTSNYLIKSGAGIDPQHQHNKVHNINIAAQKINNLLIRPGESFSFWKYVGKTSSKNGFKSGRVIVNGKLISGIGGGLCNLANTINLLVIHSPLTVTEIHHHSDALAPDVNNIRQPYSAGVSVNYNFIDYRFKNETAETFQLKTYVKDDTLFAELRANCTLPHSYKIIERNHRFIFDGEKYYRKSKIYKQTFDKSTNKLIDEKLIWNNTSEVLFDYNLIPKELIVSQN